MKERAIRFNSEMVRAILDGRKTQTRIVIKPQPEFESGYETPHENEIGIYWKSEEPLKNLDELNQLCPYGKVGDRLWVQEAFTEHECVCATVEKELQDVCEYCNGEVVRILFKVGKRFSTIYREEYPQLIENVKWKSSTQMPRWASRIDLETINVRVERVQDISEEDAKAEGVKPIQRSRELYPNDDYIFPFKELWNSTNKPEHSWMANPFVWVLDHKHLK